MFDKIIELEILFDHLLPKSRLEGLPSIELLITADQWSYAVWNAAENLEEYKISSEDYRLGVDLAKHPVFICGVHRSGTTLVRDLLDGHPQLSVLPSEGGFVSRLETPQNIQSEEQQICQLGCEWVRRLANPINQAPYWLLGRTVSDYSPYVQFARMLKAWYPVVKLELAAAKTSIQVIAAALAYQSIMIESGMHTNVLRWAEKTPTNEFNIKTLLSELPQAKIIHVIRDPLSIYTSRKRLEERILGEFRSRKRVLKEISLSLQIAASYSEKSDKGRYLLIRYEDLVAEPTLVMEQSAEFLGIAPHPNLLQPTSAHFPTYSNSSFTKDRGASAILPEITKDRLSGLTKKECELIAAYTGGFADMLGYPQEHLSWQRKKWLKFPLRLHS